MYRKILVAVDGSENSTRATLEAIDIASLIDGSSIEILLVINFEQSKNEVVHSHGKEELEVIRHKKISHIEEILKNSHVSYEIKILHGDPGEIIVDQADKGKFDLVVVGSRGLNLLQEVVLGSVSHKVSKKVHCPVLIVK
ncbi:universal stress protein [Alkalibacter mobilis]|uniref:universal stress protein n=1 Tax=Alkalibacter mobilis TaxID=2787712 RepID=UPI0018A052DF|nr:universal stress protein [Alkalibacter mobilis]MBF7097316.1 universal stress protein [Alkalibacter mobilis]